MNDGPSTPRSRFPKRDRVGIAGGLDAIQLSVVSLGGILYLIASLAGGMSATVTVTWLAAPLIIVGLSRSESYPTLHWIGWFLMFSLRKARRQTKYLRPVGGLVSRAQLRLPGGLGQLRIKEIHRDGRVIVENPVDRTVAVPLEVSFDSFRLESRSAQQNSVERWGEVLASFASHPGIVGAQVLIATGASSPAALNEFLQENGLADSPPWVQAQLAELGQQRLTSSLRHRTFLVVAFSESHLKSSTKRLQKDGRLEDGRVAALTQEVHAVQELLGLVGIRFCKWLTTREWAEVVRTGYDPASTQDIAGRPTQFAGVSTWAAGPTRVDEHPSYLVADGNYLSTWEIAELPRQEVTPDFLSALVALGCDHRLSLSYGALPPGRAERSVDRELTEVAAQQIRAEKGGGMSASTELGLVRAKEALGERLDDFADGHAGMVIPALITVSAPSRTDLELVEKQLRVAATAAHVEIQRMWVRQAAAFNVASLPLALGVKKL